MLLTKKTHGRYFDKTYRILINSKPLGKLSPCLDILMVSVESMIGYMRW